MTELSNLCGLAQVRAVKKSCHAALVFSHHGQTKHPHVADPAQDAQREHPTVQCDFFFMVAGKEDAVVAPLMVDAKVRIRYVSVAKPRNTQTVGHALMKFSQ